MKSLMSKVRIIKLQQRFGTFWPLLVGSFGLVMIFCLAVFVYMRVEGWGFWDSFYMAVITLSTVGFQEVHTLSKAGRIFTSFLIFIGVGSFMFMAGSIAQLLVEGKLHAMLGRRRVQRAIARLKGHFIICGYGRIGSIVAREIQREGFPVVIIENDPETVKSLEEEGILHIVGDATSDEILLLAGLRKAKSLITALTKEAANVYVVLTARQLNPELTIIARSDSETNINRLEMAGADRVVLPHTIGGMRMAQTVLRPTVISFVELAVRGGIELQMEELLVSPESELAGKDLIQSQIRPRYNLIIVGIKKKSGDMVFNPSPQSVIDAGDTLLAIGNKSNFEEIQNIL